MRVRTTEYDYMPVDVEAMNSRRRAHRISDDASLDADAICAASKRHDQHLLSNITDRLDEVLTPPPATVIHRHHATYRSKPPLPPSAAAVHRHVTPRHSPAVVVSAPSIKTITLKRGVRASSVPPRSSTLQEEVESYMEGASRPTPARRYIETSTESVRPYPSYRAASEPPPGFHPMADMAVKQAKRYLDRIETELGVTDSPYMVEDRPVFIPRPRAVPRTGGAHGAASHRRYVPASPSTSVPRSSRIAEIEANLELHSEEIPGPPPTSYSNLRHRAAEARDKLDRAKTMLDRYLPVYMGPENDVEYEVEHKYGELASRSAAGEGGCRSWNLTDPSRLLIYQGAPRRTGQRPGPKDRILLLSGALLSPQYQTPVRGFVRYYAKPKRTHTTTARHF